MVANLPFGTLACASASASCDSGPLTGLRMRDRGFPLEKEVLRAGDGPLFCAADSVLEIDEIHAPRLQRSHISVFFAEVNQVRGVHDPTPPHHPGSRGAATADKLTADIGHWTE